LDDRTRGAIRVGASGEGVGAHTDVPNGAETSTASAID
jgi:hypothetical protein